MYQFKILHYRLTLSWLIQFPGQDRQVSLLASGGDAAATARQRQGQEGKATHSRLPWANCRQYQTSRGISNICLTAAFFVMKLWKSVGPCQNGQFPNCQSRSFITVHGQFKSNGLGLWLSKVTVWPSKYKRMHTSYIRDKTYHRNKKSTERGGDWNFGRQVNRSDRVWLIVCSGV